MSAATLPFQIIGSGIVMGIVHVLTGPDHLSALATLSANVGNFKAFSLGVRWGIGHSTGLVVVASFLIALSEGETVDMSEKLSTVMESIVGVFMICLGVYSLTKVICGRKSSYSGENTLLVPGHGGNVDELHLDVEDGEAGGGKKSTASFEMSQTNQTSDAHQSLSEFEDPVPPEDLDEKVGYDKSRSKTTGLIALGIGIVHGIAGPGGVLGVIPAVQLHNAFLATLYLGSFCITSIVVMGTFAALYGTFSECLASATHMTFYMECFSASLSIFVGILWIVLLSLGILDEVFP